MNYKIPVYWTMFETIQIEAPSLEEAIEKSFDEPLGYGDYVDGSFTVEFDTLREIYPESPNPGLMIGFLYLNNAQYKKAKGVFEKLLERFPESSLVANNLAYIYAEYFPSKDNLKKAEKFVLNAVKVYPNQPNMLDTLGWVYYKMGDYKKSLEIFKKLRSEKLDNPGFAYHFGMCWLKNGDKEKARELLKKAANGKGDMFASEQAQIELQKL